MSIPVNDHFLRLAKRGKHPAASGGEQRAYRIAKALAEDACGLDDLAFDGLLEWADFAYKNPMKASDLLEMSCER